ncbi:S-layer homology domain-containing protein [Paenibacillus paeoniae]|uniref:S-layer homology domain-containing protein n=1 Tax=Paenibacillus paeoniae TaxID=2292705 RepID=A0A371PND8_9BACL|nr:S-layer homology domain-containing protein [Paenibacillus paeoniae]REK77698.1 S-layer homology domain-containing protein [Paenibacillus paeoniae]
MDVKLRSYSAAGKIDDERTRGHGLLLCLAIAITLFTLPSGNEAAFAVPAEQSTTEFSASESTLPDFYTDIVTPSGNARLEFSKDEIASGMVRVATDQATAQFTLSNEVLMKLKKLSPDMTIVFATASETIAIPLSELRIDADVTVQVGREEASSKLAEVLAGLESGVKAGPIRFEVSDLGQQEGDGTFSRYVERRINLGLSKITDAATVLWWDEKRNELRYVPARFQNEGVNTVAVVNSRGDGLYLIVDDPISFTDMAGHWGRQDVERLAAKGIIQGRSAEQFDPSGSLTRAETAAMLIRALGIVPSDAGSSFSDIEDKGYETAVVAAQKAGLITGYSDGTFRPNEKVTREELAVMIARAIAYTGAAQNKATGNQHLSDADRISPWALEAAIQSFDLGIIKGDAVGSFRPQAAATRAEMAAMLSRMLQSLGFM